MDPFTILILIFLLFPLLRRIFEGLKGGSEQPEKPGPAEDPWSQPERQAQRQVPTRDERRATRREERGEQSWEEFFEGLEKVLSGDEPDRSRRSEPEQQTHSASRQPETIAERRGTRSQGRTRRESTYRHPSHGPIHGGEKAPADPFSHHVSKGAEIGAQADKVNRELIEGDNPIYQDLDETPEVVVTSTRGKKYVKSVLMNSEKLRDGILIKEILDPPKSRRNQHPRF
jgi:hypothetical protein